ncbi:MAG: hypothetical protein M1838_005932 [Thelocarpon superellum]|nr:MAG: hypothetical protein M1838_005932 [Thelocarpon superellum]
MPCFKGLAVSIHTPDGPLPEHSIQRQSRHSRITSYIPVPPAKIPPDSTTNRPEQSTFAISITLLTPGLSVPYSAPAPTDEDPYPSPKVVGGLPNYGDDRGRYDSAIGPYLPLTSSPNETVAAYIYFDGRGKEEVATLLRRGEETWVNSRWVSVPESEGGGLAEREFLFREVGLERWLNGLDLDGKEAAAKTERRRLRSEQRRRRRREARNEAQMEMDSGRDDTGSGTGRTDQEGLLRYGSDGRSPVEKVSDESDLAFSSDDESDDEPPVPEAAGQIKVALFRVLASGEIKRGEYSPQFDAHDDDEEAEGGRGKGTQAANGAGADEADIDHTTSFAKPKTLDPKSISTQTVTGIDGPDKPYAVFTFLYRGERQLQKMGILPTPKGHEQPSAPTSKRRSVPTDFSKLGPLKAGGTVGFSTFRDNDRPVSRKSNGLEVKKERSMDGDSDEDEEELNEMIDKADDADIKTEDKDHLSVEDARRQGELADGLRKIKLKRAHSSDSVKDRAPRKSTTSHTPTGASPTDASALSSTPPSSSILLAQAVDQPHGPTSTPHRSYPHPGGPVDQAILGSPLKKSRPSLPGIDDQRFGSGSVTGTGTSLGLGMPGSSSPLIGGVAGQEQEQGQGEGGTVMERIERAERERAREREREAGRLGEKETTKGTSGIAAVDGDDVEL